MATIAFAGNYAGTIVSMPVSGILANKLGWESCFYVFGNEIRYSNRLNCCNIDKYHWLGAIGCIWYILWIIVVRESPDKDKHISKDELRYIQDSLGTNATKTVDHPWKEIFKSKPVYAISASHFAENWGFYTMLTQLPSFLKGGDDYISISQWIGINWQAFEFILLQTVWVINWKRLDSYRPHRIWRWECYLEFLVTLPICVKSKAG